MPARATKRTFAHFQQELASALADAVTRGINWKSTRFGTYYHRIDEAVKATYPRTVDWSDGGVRERELWEAGSQCQQLMTSRIAWRVLDPDALADKLEKVFKGSVLPPEDSDHGDEARNTLLELTTGALLHHSAFEIAITRKGPGALPLVGVAGRRAPVPATWLVRP
jgi:hypothetical protein